VAGVRVEVCPDEGREMRSSPLRRQAQRFGRRHSQPPIEFPCSAPQWDRKSPQRPAIRRMSDANNLDYLKIDPATVDALIMSHGHYDHCGGLTGLLEAQRGKMRKDLRLYTGGSKLEFDFSWLDDARSYPIWEYAGANNIPIPTPTPNPSKKLESPFLSMFSPSAAANFQYTPR